MRLDTACFVVAREPRVPSIPTRRAFLFAGLSFVAGAACGGVGVYAATAGDANSKNGEAGDIDRAAGLVPTGDADLDLLRRWALQDSIDELERNLPMFLEDFRVKYPADTYLWHGMERLADRIESGTTDNWPRLGRQVFQQTIEGLDASNLPDNARRVQSRAATLRRKQ
jgi:hypothetical protein